MASAKPGTYPIAKPTPVEKYFRSCISETNIFK